MRLEDRVAIVTGSTRGIGRGIAQLMAREGALVVVNGRSTAAVERVAGEIREAGGRAIGVAADVSAAAEIAALVEHTLDRFGRIDVLLNNAGIYEIVPTLELSEAAWDRMLAVDLKGPFLCSQAVLPHMIRQRSGRIINIASDGGKRGGSVTAAHYCAAKAGLISLTKSLAREFAGYGITVNAVSPGLIRSDMGEAALRGVDRNHLRIPLGRIGEPEDVAWAVVYLASAEAAYITGEILDVNAGLVMD